MILFYWSGLAGEMELKGPCVCCCSRKSEHFGGNGLTGSSPAEQQEVVVQHKAAMHVHT